jgi:predicted phage gp36 major capsid-like protein
VAVELKFFNHIKKWTEIGNEIRVRYDTKKWTEIGNEIRVRYDSEERYLSILKEHIRRFEYLIVQLETAAESKDRTTCHSIMDTVEWIADTVARDFPVSGKRAGRGNCWIGERPS